MIGRIVVQIIDGIQRNALSPDHALAALGVLVGALITMGTTLIAIGSGFAIAMVDSSGQQFAQNMRMSAVYYIGGMVLLVIGAKLFAKAFFKPSKKDSRSIQSAKLKILVDEMLDGTDEKLRSHDFEAYSVKKLREKGEELHTDYSILKYADTHNMVLVTEDGENIDACIENGIWFVRYGQNVTFEHLITELKKQLPRA